MWFRVDDDFIQHRKVTAAARALGGVANIGRIVAVWLEGGTWASRNLSDGFVPVGEVECFRTDPRGRAIEVMDACVQAGLVDRAELAGEPGYQYHDWHHYQPAAEDIKARRHRDRARKQGQLRNGSSSESARIPRGFQMESTQLPLALLTDIVVIPEGAPSEKCALARARDPVPDPLPQDLKAEKPGAHSRRPLRARLSIWEVRPHVTKQVYDLLESGPPYLDQDGRPVLSAIEARTIEFASKDLHAHWDYSREPMSMIDAAVGRWCAKREAEIARASFQRRERRAYKALGRRTRA